VDRPPENTTTELELDFLQRLALVSGENAPPENVEEVMVEVQSWLNAQPLDSVSAFARNYYSHLAIATHFNVASGFAALVS
jgi:hypothetical protein